MDRLKMLSKVIMLLCAILAGVRPVYAETLVPNSASVAMKFTVENNSGKIVGTVTAPDKDNSWTALPADTRINVSIMRSCPALGEEDVLVAKFDAMAPGEEKTFTDDASPAWQYGYTYTYKPNTDIEGNNASWPFSTTLEPGIKFSFDFNTTKAAFVNEDGKYSVLISGIVPDQTATYPAEKLPVNVDRIEVYRVINRSTNESVLIGTVNNTVNGEPFSYTDENPVENSVNKYIIKGVTDFGISSYTLPDVFVGYDVPRSPYPVNAVEEGNGVKITWKAPVDGVNYGTIKPENTVYNVFRAWGRGENERELIASKIKETEYTDYGTDLSMPRKVRYEVQAENDMGVGGTSQANNTYENKFIVGPAYKLPFIETFDGGENLVWNTEAGYYYLYMEAAENYAYASKTVEPAEGTGMFSIYFLYTPSGEQSCTMKSFKIDTKDAVNPALSFMYYALPGKNISIKVSASSDGTEFAPLGTVNYATATEEGWKTAVMPLTETSDMTYILFTVDFAGDYDAVLLDCVKLVDYKPVGAIDVEYDSEACTATLTWSDPSAEYAQVKSFEGFVDGKSVGTVTSPWVFQAEEHKKAYNINVKAIYEGVEAPLSSPVVVSVPRPPYTEFTADNYVFFIEDKESLSVKQYLGNDMLIKVPELVTYDGVTYQVIAVGNAAFKGNANIISVTVPEGVLEIRDEAFAGCTELSAVSFSASLAKIGSKAFAGCLMLETVIFSSKTAPEVAADAFEGIATGCKGQCPAGMEKEYAAVPGLAPIDFGVSGIYEIIVSGAAEVEYFDLNGRPTAPVAGKAVIVRATMPDGKVRVAKTVVR